MLSNMCGQNNMCPQKQYVAKTIWPKQYGQNNMAKTICVLKNIISSLNNVLEPYDTCNNLSV